MLSRIDKAHLRALQYWYVDGLAEIAFGGILLVLAAYFYLQDILPPGSLLYQLLDIGFVLVLVFSGFLGGRFVSFFKNRLTYPRTGYVAYPRVRGWRRWLGVLLAIPMGALVAGLFIAAPASLAWMPAVAGLILALVMLTLGRRFGLLRFYLMSLFVLALGIGLALAGIGNLLGSAIFYALSGALLLLSGCLTLRVYLRTAPSPDPSSVG